MSPTQNQMQLRITARTAAGDLVHAAREFLGAATRLTQAVRAWDPTGQREDPMILGAAETAGELLALAAAAAPGVRLLLLDALAASEPAAPAPAAAPPQEA